MAYLTKKFNKDNYDKNDTPAKATWVKILEAKNHKVDELKESYKYDVVSYDPETGEQRLWELEVRQKKHFTNILNRTYKTIHIPYRKIIYRNKSDFYIGFDEDFKTFFAIPMQYIKAEAELTRNVKPDVRCFVDGKWITDTMIDVAIKLGKVEFFKVNDDYTTTEFIPEAFGDNDNDS